MDEAEAHNAAGNDAFNAGNYIKASELYFEAVKANGKVAKYRTNLCNALMKRGRPAEALEEAAAAIAVDGGWPKGHFYKALALEQLCKLPEALAACEKGLRLHRHNAPLEDMHSRLQKQKRELEQQQQRLAAGAVEQRTVVYAATVRDGAGHERAFRYEHQVDSARLARAAADKAEATRIIQEVAMPHYHEMLQAQPWLCVGCQLQDGKRQRATKLFLHPMSYLTKPQPLVYDMGPTPACGSQACATYATQMAQQIVSDIMHDEAAS
ncbi:hypothetical protein OEZ86_011398 [Tetradesmus obliquus]|nr:hypothetical protein OEZ86_011398 [Tetradesmus obliquus]